MTETRDRVDLAEQIMEREPGRYTKKFLAEIFDFSRNSFYIKHKLDQKDKELAIRIERLYETDDTLGPKKVAVLLKRNRKSVRRVMKKYGIKPRRNKKKYRYHGKGADVAGNLLKISDIKKYEVIFSDIFEFRLKDGSKVYCCFMLRKLTRQIISFCYSYNIKADLVVDTIEHIDMLDIKNSKVIMHNDRGKQYGASVTVDKIIELQFIRSMSKPGTPTDNPFAERFVGVFKLAVVKRQKYDTVGAFIDFAQKWLNFYNNKRPHEALKMLSPNQFAENINIQTVPYLAVNCAQ